MWQVCIFERTTDGREVPSPVVGTPSENVARRVYKTLGELVETLSDYRPIGLYEHDPDEPTGWREVLSTRRLVSPRRAA